MNGKREAQGELDLSFTSDLKDAHADGGGDGKTVAGTSPDEAEGTGKTTTTMWPSRLDRDDYTENRQEIIEATILGDYDSLKEIGRHSGTSQGTAREALKQAYDDLEDPDSVPIDFDGLISSHIYEAEIKRRYQNGESPGDIYVDLGIGRNSVVGVCRHLDRDADTADDSEGRTEDNSHVCQTCGEQFENPQVFGGHLANCEPVDTDTDETDDEPSDEAPTNTHDQNHRQSEIPPAAAVVAAVLTAVVVYRLLVWFVGVIRS